MEPQILAVCGFCTALMGKVGARSGCVCTCMYCCCHMYEAIMRVGAYVCLPYNYNGCQLYRVVRSWVHVLLQLSCIDRA